MTDEEMLVELRDMKQRLAVMIEGVSANIADRELRVKKILQAVREAEVAEGFQSCAHECAIPERFAEKVDSCGE